MERRRGNWAMNRRGWGLQRLSARVKGGAFITTGSSGAGARTGGRNTGLARRQLPRILPPDPERTRVVMEVCVGVRSWSGEAETGPARRQLPSSARTAPRVVSVGTSTTTTPATTVTESVMSIESN